MPACRSWSAGLDRVNVSLDTTSPDRFRAITAPEIPASLRAEFTLTPLAGRGSAPAELFEVDGGPGPGPGPGRSARPADVGDRWLSW
ncbi:hypothetical protein Franean1_0587 [Parafrankia sp. EAN1pec]|nr:hypothetical protein Franean1_0587 [Frankia sp. EAN1pec]